VGKFRLAVVTARVLAACVVARLHNDPGSVGTTAIDKQPVEGAVRVGPYGLHADVQADRKHHGGLEQAVYAYSAEDADWWAEQLQRDIPPGLFGENLRVAGVDMAEVRVGERWRIGDVELEATGPRIPCQTFARWMGEADNGWVKRFAQARRLGTYFRVLSSGRLQAGDVIDVTPAPAEAPRIVDLAGGAVSSRP
jgi:Uncharacterized protein conserved in bacteria